jgi:hypothetical protein
MASAEHTVARKLRTLLLVLLPAIGLTLATLVYQQYGPIMGEHGNACGPVDSGQLCIAPVLQAGWPLPYLFDNPTISVPDKLFIEDKVNAGFLAVDVLFFACIIVAMRRVMV